MLRSLANAATPCATGIALALALFHLGTAAFGQLPDLMQRSVHVAGALALGFLLRPAEPRTGTLAVLGAWGLSIASLGIGAYMLARYDAMATIGYWASPTDVAVGVVAIALVLEAARRAVGLFFPLLAVLAILYALFGAQIPGALGHRGMDPVYLVEVVFTTTRGLWGVVTGVSATVIAIFVLFGAILFRTGGGQAFMDISLYISGRGTAGVGKMATIASGLFGSLSGSAAANIATTGAFTIPMMKRAGFAPPFAAGVEASASMGGQLMPPIMGAGAFVMAELLGTSYGHIAAGALLPALLFYAGVFLSVHLHGRRYGYRGLPAAEIPRPRTFLKPRRSLPLFVPLAVLIGLLMLGYTPTFAGFWSIVAAVTLFLVLEVPASGLTSCLNTLRGALIDAGKGLVTVAVLIACAQIILALIASTGLGVKVSGFVVSLGADSLFLSLLLAMGLAILLGMGLPTTAAYLLAATVLAPALETLGIAGLQAHLFIFYFAIAAGITPPLCAGVFIAASMAKASWTETLGHALRLSYAALFVPFIFVLHPELLLQGSAAAIAIRVVQAVLFVGAASVALSGYLAGRLRLPARLGFALAAVGLLIPDDRIAAAAGVGLMALVAYQIRAGAPSASSSVNPIRPRQP